MIRDTHTDMAINVPVFHGQHALIRHMVTELESGRTGILIMSNLPALIGILGTLDEINGQNNLDGADKAPECPGCTHPGNCEDCEYQYDTDLCPTTYDTPGGLL